MVAAVVVLCVSNIHTEAVLATSTWRVRVCKKAIIF